MSDMGIITSNSAKYIHADISSRLHRNITPHDNILSKIENCANDSVTLAQKAFITYPDSTETVYEYLRVQTHQLLPDDLQTVAGTSPNISMFKSLLGMLSVKSDCFTPQEKKIYQKVSHYLKSYKEVQTRNGINHKDDKKLWLAVTPLVQKYGKEIFEDLTAHMLDQSINAWCYQHNNVNRDWANNNLDKVFDKSVRTYFDILDSGIARLSRTDDSYQFGSLMRHAVFNLTNVIATIPLTLHYVEEGEALNDTLPKPDSEPVPSLGTSQHGASVEEGAKGITVYGSKTVVNGGQCCHIARETVSAREPWSAIVEQLLASNKLSDAQCYALLKDLIAAMTQHPSALTQALNQQIPEVKRSDAQRHAPALTPEIDYLLDDVEALPAPLSPLSKFMQNRMSPVETPEQPESVVGRNSARRHSRQSSIAILERVENTSSASSPLALATPSLRASPSQERYHTANASPHSVASGASSASLYEELTQRLKTLGLAEPHIPGATTFTNSTTTHSSSLASTPTTMAPLNRDVTSVHAGIPAKNPLSNFSIATFEERRRQGDSALFTGKLKVQTEEPQGNTSPLLQRRQQQELRLPLPLSIQEKEKDEDTRERTEADGQEDATQPDLGYQTGSPALSLLSSDSQPSSGIVLEDAEVLKRWLKTSAAGYDLELRAIDALKADGLRINTLEHFLETAFIASPGSAAQSDLRQTYIKYAFKGLRDHEESNLLSDKTRALVEKYAVKQHGMIFATTPTRTNYRQHDMFWGRVSGG